MQSVNIDQTLLSTENIHHHEMYTEMYTEMYNVHKYWSEYYFSTLPEDEDV